jgi:hypothetical protein
VCLSSVGERGEAIKYVAGLVGGRANTHSKITAHKKRAICRQTEGEEGLVKGKALLVWVCGEAK